MREWITNDSSKTVLSGIPNFDLGLNILEIDLSAELMPDLKTLGLVRDVENDRLRVCSKHQKLCEITTRREMLGAPAGQFGPLGILASCLLEGKLFLQKVTIWGRGWDDDLPENILKNWNKWVNVLGSFVDLSIPRYCFLEGNRILGR